MFGKSEDYRDYQHTACPISAMACDVADRRVTPVHSHRRGQLFYVSAGVYEVETTEGTWLAPPQRALWIPPGIEHSARASGNVALRTVYIESPLARGFPDTCAAVFVGDLLRALILEAVRIPNAYDERGREGQIMALLLEEIHPAPATPLHLPMPSEARIARVCRTLREDPALALTLNEWGQRVGASERTLARLFRRETGMSFARWRQQARLLVAVDRLARGENIATIAEQLGYRSPSAFSQMFRQALGTAPTAYFALTKS